MTDKDMQEPMTASQRAAAAELITPPNKLKAAVGSGGIDTQQIRSAQRALEVTASVTDFRTIAMPLLNALKAAFDEARSGKATGPEALEAMMYPAMQMKAQGGMFKYTLITEICNTLVNFLETLDNLDKNAIEIVDAYIKTIHIIIKNAMNGDGGPKGKALRDALTDACNRYYRVKLG